MSRPLLIIGGGGLARETAATIDALNRAGAGWDLRGFVDQNPALHGTQIGGRPVLGNLDMVAAHADARILLCTASPSDPASRRRLAAQLALPAERYATVVHPAAQIGTNVRLGPGTIVLATAVFTCDIRVGAHVVVMPGVVATHDDEISDYATFGAGALLAGRVRIGQGAYIGAGAKIREERTIGDWAIVGMGAVVLRDVPGGQVWAGNPAQLLRPASRSHSGRSSGETRSDVPAGKAAR
jgi:sugar O-acyltransferase (sialic acid O-acetyltransferase NeuD family)